MRSEAVATNDPSSAERATMAEQMRQTKQRLLEVTAQRREPRARLVEGSAIEPTSTLPLARAVAAVVNSLPSTGAVMMDWSEALRLAHLAALLTWGALQLRPRILARRAQEDCSAKSTKYAGDISGVVPEASVDRAKNPTQSPTCRT